MLMKRYYLQCPKCNVETTAIFDDFDNRKVPCDNCGFKLTRTEHCTFSEDIILADKSWEKK